MPVGFEHIELVGDKVRLRPVREADAEDTFRLMQDDRVLSQLADGGAGSLDEQREAYRGRAERLRTGEGCSLAIEEVANGIIGCISARPRFHPRQIDIGYWLGVPHWNQGYMTEAVRLICHLSFKHLDATRAYATVFVGNIGSRRVLEKNGFSVDGTLRSHVFKHGQFVDSRFMTLLRSEWEVAKARYTPRHEDIIVARGE